MKRFKSFSSNPLILKFFFNILLMIFITYMCFSYFPEYANYMKTGTVHCAPISKDCFVIYRMWAVLIYYLIWLFYFILSINKCLCICIILTDLFTMFLLHFNNFLFRELDMFPLTLSLIL